jgi:ATP-binding cassette subfamily C (CFTR/MRP) protein 1
MASMVNLQQTAYHLTFAAQCWLSVRLEFCGTMIVCVACFVAIMQHDVRGGDEQFAGLAGLSISFALSVTQALNWTVRMASDVEANMVAVERITQYFEIPSEAPRLTLEDEDLPSNWPAEGRIEFINSKLRYRPGLPLVLKGLNISIPPQSKVGVVGRTGKSLPILFSMMIYFILSATLQLIFNVIFLYTGAGKSTLMVVLLRICELDSGSIKIDGVDIRSVGLKKLRSKIAVIPQDPVLFSGTVRTNLDPFDEFSDDRLFEVLQHVGLYSPMTKNISSISLASSHMSGNSSNAAVGGRTQPIKSLSESF